MAQVSWEAFPGGVVVFRADDTEGSEFVGREQLTLMAADVPVLAREVRKALVLSGQLTTLAQYVENDPTAPLSAVRALSRVLEGPLTGVCRGIPYVITPGEREWLVYVWDAQNHAWAEPLTGVGVDLGVATRQEAQENLTARLLFDTWEPGVDDATYVLEAPERLRISLLDEFQHRRNYLAIFAVSGDVEEAAWFAGGPLGTSEAWRRSYYQHRLEGFSRTAAAQAANTAAL